MTSVEPIPGPFITGTAWLRRATGVCAGLVALAAVLVLVGWAFDVRVLKSVVPGYITMKANTALSFLLDALALELLRRWPRVRAARAVAVGLVVLVIGLCAATLAEYLLGRDLGIDQLLVTDYDGRDGRFPPGRLAPVTAVNFLVLGLALGLTSLHRRTLQPAVQTMTFVAFLASFQALVSYSVGVRYAFGAAYYTQIAVHTAVLFVLLCGGIIALRPDEGFMAVLAADTVGGILARRLLAWAILVPPLVNWCQLLGQRMGLYDADFGSLLRVLGNVAFFTLLVVRSAEALHQADLRRRDADAARVHLVDALQHSVRLRDDFLSICSHELRTPLTSLHLQTEVVSRRIDRGGSDAFDPTVVRTFVANTARQIHRLRVLIEDMLDVSRFADGPIALSIQRVDLTALVQTVVQLLAESLQRAGITVTVTAPSDLLIQCDPARIEQVLSKLLVNTVKYAGGQAVVIHLEAHEARVRVTVTDGGMGIDPVHHARIFEPFERAVPWTNISGLGVGLYLARRIVEAHGGTLSLASTPGAGAAFTMDLPMVPAGVSSAAEAPLPV